MSLAATTGNSRHSGYARAENDWYVEPSWAVEALLDVERFRGYTHDPACGCGTIPKAFRARDLEAGGSDIADRGFGDHKVDFLSPLWLHLSHDIQNIVTNPPFKLALDFVRKALEISDHKVAVLQRLAWLESRERGAFFESSPLARVYVFSRRVSMPPGGSDQPATGGSIPFAWYVWDKDHRGAPELRWLP
jgi:hypothetical protein